MGNKNELLRFIVGLVLALPTGILATTGETCSPDEQKVVSATVNGNTAVGRVFYTGDGLFPDKWVIIECETAVGCTYGSVPGRYCAATNSENCDGIVFYSSLKRTTESVRVNDDSPLWKGLNTGTEDQKLRAAHSVCGTTSTNEMDQLEKSSAEGSQRYLSYLCTVGSQGGSQQVGSFAWVGVAEGATYPTKPAKECPAPSPSPEP